MVHKKKKKILIDGEIFESNEVKKYLKKFLYSKFVDKERRNEIIASLDCRNNKEIFIDGIGFCLKINIEILPTNIYDENGKFVLEKRNENKKNSKVIQKIKNDCLIVYNRIINNKKLFNDVMKKYKENIDKIKQLNHASFTAMENRFVIDLPDGSLHVELGYHSVYFYYDAGEGLINLTHFDTSHTIKQVKDDLKMLQKVEKLLVEKYS